MTIIMDTNAWHAYHMDFPVVPKGGGPTVRVQRRGRDGIVAMADRAIELGNLAIPDVVAGEVRSGTERAFDSAARRAGSPDAVDRRVVQALLDGFNLLYGRFGIHNVLTYLGAVERMYIDAWLDPRMAAAVDRWRRVKRRHGEGTARPSLDTHGADFVILSTAAALATQGDEVWLVTSDYDFVAFADMIYRVFGVRVVDGSAL